MNRRSASDRGVFGYNFTTKFETKFGGENASVQSTVGFEATTSGEFSEEVARTDEKTESVEFKTTLTAEPGMIARVLQNVMKTDIEIDITDHLIIDMPFEIWTYKNGGRDSRILDSPDIIRGGDMRRHFMCTGIDDLSLTLRGKNRRYPRVPKNNFHNWQHAPVKMGSPVNMRKLYERFTNLAGNAPSFRLGM